MERIRTVDHRGVPVLVADYPKLRSVDGAMSVTQESALAIRMPGRRAARLLMVMGDLLPSPALWTMLRDAHRSDAQYLVASAVTGLSGVMGALYRAEAWLTGVPLCEFGTGAEALDRLAAQ